MKLKKHINTEAAIIYYEGIKESVHRARRSLNEIPVDAFLVAGHYNITPQLHAAREALEFMDDRLDSWIIQLHSIDAEQAAAEEAQRDSH